jgi:hypothetical protein
MLYSTLHCTAMHCTIRYAALHCTVLYCTTLSAILHCTALYCTVLSAIVYCTVLCCPFCCTVLSAVLHCTVLSAAVSRIAISPLLAPSLVALSLSHVLFFRSFHLHQPYILALTPSLSPFLLSPLSFPPFPQSIPREKYIASGLIPDGKLQHLISDAATMQIIRWTKGGFGM